MRIQQRTREEKALCSSLRSRQPGPRCCPAQPLPPTAATSHRAGPPPGPQLSPWLCPQQHFLLLCPLRGLVQGMARPIPARLSAPGSRRAPPVSQRDRGTRGRSQQYSDSIPRAGRAEPLRGSSWQLTHAHACNTYTYPRFYTHSPCMRTCVGKHTHSHPRLPLTPGYCPYPKAGLAPAVLRDQEEVAGVFLPLARQRQGPWEQGRADGAGTPASGGVLPWRAPLFLRAPASRA